MTQEQSTELFRSHFEEFERGLNGESSSRFHELRTAAIARFEEVGFPSTRDEEWRFTNVAPIARLAFARAPQVRIARPAIEPHTFARAANVTLVFVNGRWSEELSTIGAVPPGARVTNLASTLKYSPEMAESYLGRFVSHDSNGFTALNTAFSHDGAFVFLPDNTVVDSAIHLLYVSTADASPWFATPRNLIVTGNNCRLSVVESYVAVGGGTCLTNVVSEIVVGENTVVEHDKLQLESVDAFHVGTTHFHQAGASVVTSNSIALGGSIVRNTVTAVLDGKGIECTLNGLSLGTGRQLIDNHTVIDHAQPHCASHELYKAILDGASRGVFNGKIFVRKDAQKTDAKQTNKTLLLSDDATVDAKPQLEIFADDVKCTHGAAVGQLDDEQLFYLRSRGLGETVARDLLTFAFASDVIERVHVEPLRRQLDALLHSRLRAGRITDAQ